MRVENFIRAMLLVSFAGLCPAGGYAKSVDKSAVTTQDVVEEVGRHTGIASDTLQAVRGSSPELIENLKDTVTAIKVVDLYSQARDTEALVEIYEWQKGKLLDKAAEQLLPQNMITVIAVIRAYKASLESIRDNVFIPSLEESIYRRYKSARGGKLDYRYSSPDEAYDQATGSGSYFPAKQKMYDELVKSHGYNPALMGHKLEADLWKRVDGFWKNRLEAKYTQELVKKNRDSLVKEVWKNSSGDLDRLRKAAAQLSQPKPVEKKKVAKPKQPEDEFKKLKGLFKDILDPVEKDQPKATQQEKPAPSAGSASQGSTLNFKQKSGQPAAGGVKSGQRVQSCSQCAQSGMDCICGYDRCVCCSPGATCSPY